MDCPACGQANPDGFRYCGGCGRPLPTTCPRCGAANPAGQKFCGECGAPLIATAAAESPQAHLPSPASAPAARGTIGERRQATVLFSDLSGYTAMNERLDPEEVRGIVGRIKGEAVRIVEGHGGIVNQFVGDEVVALFGIPQAHEDDPVRAVRAARDLHALVRAMSPEVEGRIGAPLRLHTGVSSGLIVTGTEDRRDGTYGITGDAVNTGARLASHADIDTVLVSEETQRLIADFFQVEPLEPVELKGKSGRVTPYRVVEQTGVSSRFEAAAQRGFTAYAGREAELGTLHASLEQARAGQGQFVTVMGEPGIGKSRLLFEFRHGVPREQAVVLTGHCQSYGTDTPYLPMVDALRRGLRLEEAGGADALHDHVVKAVRAISPALERYLPQYLHLLSIPSAEHPIPKELQGDALRRAFEEAFAAILTENARRQPMALILEDWHWADEASDSALRHLAGLVPHHPLQVVVSYRPDYERKWANPQNYQPLVLQPLGEAETAAMLRSVWKAEQLPDGLAAQIHARTGGNALFNEEVARGLRDAGTVRVDDGRAVLSGDLTRLHLPDSVHAVIRARVDRLDPDSRDVLRLASVIGREFTRPLLERLYPSPAKLHHALDALAHQDLIHPLRVVPEPAYLFKHALVQDVVYDTLLLSQRKELHEQVGATIEALYADRLEEQYEALAGHYSKTDDTEKAVVYLEKAGDKAAKSYALREAREHFGDAIKLMPGPMQSDQMRHSFVRAALGLARSSILKPSPEVLRCLDICFMCASELRDGRAQAQCLILQGRLNFSLGNLPESVRLMASALEIAARNGYEDLIAIPTGAVGRASVFSGKIREGLNSLRQAADLSEKYHQLENLAYTKAFLTMSFGMCGHFAEASSAFEDSLRIARELGNPVEEAGASQFLGVAEMLRGNFESAFKSFWRNVEISERLGNVVVGSSGLGAAGYCHYMNRKPKLGYSFVKRAISGLESVGSRLGLDIMFGYYAEMLALSREWKDACDHARKCLELIGQSWTLGRWFAVQALAMACAQSGDQALAEKTENSLQESIQWSTQESARPLKAVTHFRYAEIQHKKGDLPAALQQLSQAEKLFAEMEMTWWSGQAAGLRARIEGGKPFVWFAPYVDGPPKV
jgi:class 3 adenylate cyclase/tetratricopeptide (TPR) repeat protein